MPEIKDTGKVWIRGAVRPVFAIRVDNEFFVPGKEDGHSIENWVENGFLCIDLHDAGKRVRMGRRFPLGMAPTVPAALFSGFERTQHADVMVTTDEGAQAFILKETDYETANAALLDRQAFWQLASSAWSEG